MPSYGLGANGRNSGRSDPVSANVLGRRAGIALATVLLGLMLAACGRGSSASAPPSTTAARQATSPPTSAPHTTPSSLLPTLQRALYEQTHEQYAEAVVDFLSIVKADPANQIAWYDLGVIAHTDGQNAQAISDYRSALAGDPDYIPGLYNLAVLETADQPKDAAALYQQVIQLQPNSADAHLNLGFILESLGQAANAKAQFADAIHFDAALASRVPAAEAGKA
jgi:tetratricopeptide (TPR) repeat protein